MKQLARFSSAFGGIGLLVCLAASAGRFYGTKQFMGFQAVNIFIVGVGLLVTACWLRLESSASDD